MTVAPWHQPDFTVDTAAVYKAALDADFSILKRLGIMFAPSAQTVANMTVLLQAGHVFDGITLTELATQNSATIVAPVSNPRIDRIVIDKVTGVISVVTGTPAASPVAPAIPSGKCPVAKVALTNATTSITNSLITDERDFTGLGGLSNQPPYGVTTNSTNAYSVTTSPNFAALSTGMQIFVKINAANTGSATLNPNAIGAVTIKDNYGNNLSANALLANSTYQMLYDGTNFILLTSTMKNLFLPYAADTGAADAYAIAPAPAVVTAATTGMFVTLIPTHTNTTTSTLAVNAIAGVTIKMPDGSNTPAGAITSGYTHYLSYNGTNWILLNPSVSVFIGTVILTSSSGTYTPSANANKIKYKIYASSGGGGAVSDGSNGGNGATSSLTGIASASGGTGGLRGRLGILGIYNPMRGPDGVGSSGAWNGVGLVGGSAGMVYEGGGQNDIGQDGGFGGLAIGSHTLSPTEKSSGIAYAVGAAGAASTNPRGYVGKAGYAGYIEIDEYT